MNTVRKTSEPLEEERIVPYREAVSWIIESNRRRTRDAAPRILRFPHTPPKDEPYATIEMDYEGDFSPTKDPFEYVLHQLKHD